MLKDNPNEGLLPNEKDDLNKSSLQENKDQTDSKTKLEDREEKPLNTSKKKERSQVTYILKVLNLVVGLSYIGFAVFFYMNGN